MRRGEDRAPLTRGETIGQASLYCIFGSGLMVGGWLIGSLFRTEGRYPFAKVAWTLCLPVVLASAVVLFVARPVRPLHRAAWALTGVVGVVGFFREVGWLSAVSTALVAIAISVIPRRKPWSWA